VIEKAPRVGFHLPIERQSRMGVAKKVLRTLKAKTYNPQDTVEDSPETLDTSYQRQLEMLIRIRRAVADVTAAREHIESQMSAMCPEQEEPDDQTVQVSNTGTNQRGRQEPESKAALATAISDLAAQHNALQAQEEKLVAASRGLEVKVEAFRVRKEAIKAVYKVAEAEQRISEALSSIYKGTDNASTSAISSQRQFEALAQVRGDVEEVVASREHLGTLASSLRQLQAELEGRARRALGTGREDLAREALAQKAAIEGQLSDLESQLNSIQAQEARLATAYERLAAKIEVFQAQNGAMPGTYSASEAESDTDRSG
jgi:phage shock protein A